MALQSFILCMVVFAVSAATVPLLEGKEQHTQLVPRTLDIDRLKQSMTASFSFTLVIIGLIVLVMELYQAMYDQIQIKTYGDYEYDYNYDYDDYDYDNESESDTQSQTDSPPESDYPTGSENSTGSDYRTGSDYPTGSDDYSSYSSFKRRSLRNSLTNMVLNSIDPVNMLFKYMAIDDEACRQKAVCKASSISLIAKSIRNMSPYVRGLEKYKDAVDVGEALEDCSLLFAECQDY